MEKKNVDNAVELVKQYEYQSMVFKKNKENLIREYNNQFKSYKVYYIFVLYDMYSAYNNVSELLCVFI